jgi:stringent starvation protein B
MRLRVPILKATYEWLLDAGLTPYFLVNADYPKVMVPTQFVEEGHIVLDASADAIDQMHFDETGISFNASFDELGVVEIYFPIAAVEGVYAEETEQGVFTTDHPTALLIQEGEVDEDEPVPAEAKPTTKKPSRSFLKVVK